MRQILAKLFIICGIACPGYADVACNGSVNNIMVNIDGDLFVNFGLPGTRIKFCNLNNSTTVYDGSVNRTLTVPTCQSYLAGFTTAKATGQYVQLVRTTNCTFSDGSLPNPYPYQVYFYVPGS